MGLACFGQRVNGQTVVCVLHSLVGDAPLDIHVGALRSGSVPRPILVVISCVRQPTRRVEPCPMPPVTRPLSTAAHSPGASMPQPRSIALRQRLHVRLRRPLVTEGLL